MKRRVAVFFGGRSPEHDISVITGLQVLKAVDQERFEAFPVYVTPRGTWLVGAPLAARATYMPDPATLSKLTEVTLDLGARGQGILIPRQSGLFGRKPGTSFDVALLAFHGSFGEDGRMQGLFEVAGLPYTGMRAMASAILMDKVATKRMLTGLGIPLLPQALVTRPQQGLIPPREALERVAREVSFPACVKPVHLGSSIGVAKVDSLDELQAVLPAIFNLDHAAMVEPFVENLVEYNISVRAHAGGTQLSAIERPKRSAELLDFREKYLSGSKTGGKQPGESSEGMLSLTRDINPPIAAPLAQSIRDWARLAYEAIGGTGAPRIDFLGNERTGEIWLNEINPCPGSFSYFLWEAAEKPVLFTDLVSDLIEEAVAEQDKLRLPDDPTPQEARILPRR